MIAEDIVFEGKKYILGRVAARLTKYSNDYIGELCRSAKVKAKQIGKLWYIDEDSLLEYKNLNGKQGFGAQKIIDARKEDYHKLPSFKESESGPLLPEIKKEKVEEIFTYNPIISTVSPSSPANKTGQEVVIALAEAINRTHAYTAALDKIADLEKKVARTAADGAARGPAGQKTDFEAPQKPSFFIRRPVLKFAALLLVLSISAAGYFAVNDKETFSQTDRALFPPSAQVALASVSQSVSSLFSDAVRRFTDILLSGFGNIFASPEESDPSLARQLAKLKEEVARLKSKSFTIVESTDQAGPSPGTLPQAAVNRPVTERVILRTVSVSGISQDDLNKLENSLKSEIYRVASTASSQNNATYQTVALSNRINQLANLAISGAAITSSTYAGSIAGTSGSFESLSVTGTLSAATVTFTGPLTVSATSTFSAPGIFSFAPAQAHTFGAWAVGVAGANPAGAALLVNPSAAAADSNLLSLSVAGSAKFLIDAEGDVFANSITASGGVTLSTTTASTFSVENNTTLGDATTTDKTFFNSRIGSSLIPTVNNLLDIGDTTNGLAWRTGIFGTSIGIGTTTPYAALSVVGQTVSTYFTATSTTATSTFAGGLTAANAGFNILQNGTVGIGTSAPVASALLQLDSTTRGFLSPRLTTAQKNAIVSPAAGLLLYDNTLNKLNVYNGAAWKNVGSTEIGGEVTGGSTGSVLFIGDGAVLGQDVNNFNYSTSTGRLGVGTTSPYARLSVWGGGTGTGQLFELISSASTTLAKFNDNGTGYFLGNIGIGTTSPYRKLSVTDTVSAAQAVIAYDSSRFTELQTNSVGDFIITTQGNDAFLNNDNLWVCTGGACPAGTPSGFGNLIVENKLGVGTSSPYATLSIVGETVSSYFTAISTTATSTFAGIFAVGTTSPPASSFFTVGTSSPLFVVDKNSGNITFSDSAGNNVLIIDAN